MPTALQSEQTTTKNDVTDERYIFVVQQHDGKYLVGCSTNPCKRICAINSGLHPFFKKGLTIKRIVGIKPVDENRNLVSTFKLLEDQLGVGNVIAV